jgi:lipopolysaccharide transport system ATP-binding protein
LDGNGAPTSVLKAGEPVRFVFHLNKMIGGVSCLFVIFDNLGQHLALFESSLIGAEDKQDPGIGSKFICDLDELLLLPGRYRINVIIRDSGEKQDVIEAAAVFDVVGGQLNGRPLKQRKRVSVYMPHRWTSPGGL